MGHTVQQASQNDIEIIRDLALKIWPETYGPILSQDQITYMLDMMYSPASLKKQMETGAHFILVKDVDEPVAFASYQQVQPSVVKLHKIYVLPSQQGKGTGRFIIDHILATIKPAGATALQLQVNKNNKARNFYEHLGFKVIDEIKLDIGSGYVMDDYIMEKRW